MTAIFCAALVCILCGLCARIIAHANDRAALECQHGAEVMTDWSGASVCARRLIPSPY